MPAATPDPSARPLPRPRPQIVARTLPDGAVLFDPGSETYFGLNATGTIVWELIGTGGADVAAAVGRICAEHPDAVPAQVLGDVLALLDELARAGLVDG